MTDKVIAAGFILFAIVILGLLRVCELNRDDIHRLTQIVEKMNGSQ